jgi:hypothetical protein
VAIGISPDPPRSDTRAAVEGRIHMSDHIAHRLFDTGMVGGVDELGLAARRGVHASRAERPGPTRGLTGTSAGTEGHSQANNDLSR